MAVQTAPALRADRRVPLPAVLRRESLPATVAVATLVALPLLVYGVPAMAGHVVAPGDDLTQSLPLRELVGRDLSAGHLPVFDPYLWSGAPLLAGWNAGAAYPMTWLFAVLPAVLAWTVSLASAVIAAGVGCYAFLRANGLRVVASWVGAVTFAFGGGMTAQVSHVGLVVGMAWVPLGLLAILRLTERRGSHAGGGRGRSTGTRAGRARAGRGAAWGAAWAAVLATSVGLVVLAGEPRAIADAATVLVVYGLWRLARLGLAARRHRTPPGRVAWAILAVAGGGALGLGLGAVQLVPGLAAVATSQRAAVTSFLFSAGSLPAQWLLLLGLPNLLGGSGALGSPAFFGSYNLTEVTGYVGMLPLVAAGALLGGVRRRMPLPEWAVWYVVAGAGILLALGAHTPLWHMLIRIPLFGGQRLQSRSLLVTDLALAMLVAYWADRWLSAERPMSRAERLAGTVIPASVVVVVAVALAWPAALFEWMGVAPSVAVRSTGVRPWLVPFLVLAIAAAALVSSGGRGRRVRGTRTGVTARLRRLRPAMVVAFAVVDLAVFAVTTEVAMGTPAATAAHTTVEASTATSAGARVRRSGAANGIRPIATLHLGGRFAVYDPALHHPGQLAELGATDANVLEDAPSVQGYGSIVDGRYARATGTHGVSGTGQDVFSARAAEDGVLDALDTTAILVPSDYLVRAGAPAPNRLAPGRLDGSTASETGGRADRRTVGPGRRATWELGTPQPVTAVSVPGRLDGSRGGAAPASARIGLVRPDGTVDWASAVATSRTGTPTWRARWPAAVRAVAVTVAATATATLAPPLVATAGGARIRPDGALDAALVPPHWTYDGRDGAFAVYRNQRADRPLRLQALPGGSTAGATVTRRTGTALDPRTARVDSPHGVVVVRAVAAIPGWTATWAPASTGGRRPAVVPLTVHRDGVVQAVQVPPGRGTLAWQYRAPGIVTGALVSAGSLAAVLVMAGAALVATATRRRTTLPRARRAVTSVP